MRIRTRDDQVFQNYELIGTFDGVPTGSNLYTHDKVGEIKTTIDDHPYGSLAARCKDSPLPLRPFEVSTMMVRATPHSGIEIDPAGRLAFTGTRTMYGTAPLLPPADIPPAAAAQAANTALANAKSFDFDGLTFLAEAGKTAQLLSRPLDGITRLGTKIAGQVSKKERGVERLLAFNSLWLEARYAWRPLVYEANGIWESFKSFRTKAGLSEGRGSVKVSRSDDAVKIEHENPDSGDVRTTVKREVDFIARALARFTVDMGKVDIQMNFLTTAWELIPFSFVIDRFIDVGTALNAVSPRAGFTGGESCSSVRSTVTTTTTSTWLQNGNWGVGIDLSDYKKVVEIESYVRTLGLAPQLPGFLPRLDDLFILDLVALAIASRAKVLRRLVS